jgi:hypothetical protein
MGAYKEQGAREERKEEARPDALLSSREGHT